MARPRSEDKRNAILEAATRVIAVEGVSAPTAKIAKLARVAEGTLFTYFNNKDELLNELYLQLKAELRETMAAQALKATKSLKATALHAWTHYVSWGVANPEKRKVLAQLGVSDRITAKSKAAGMVGFTELNARSSARRSARKYCASNRPPSWARCCRSCARSLWSSGRARQ